MAMDASGNIYFVDQFRVKKYDASSGAISTIAGTGSNSTFHLISSPGGTTGFFDGDNGPAVSAAVSPGSLALDTSDNIYFSDTPAIRKISTAGIITTYQSFQFNNTRGLAVDASGSSIYVSEGQNTVTKYDVNTGQKSTFAGNMLTGFDGDGFPAAGHALGFPSGLALNSAGELFIADYFNSRIRKVSGGSISTVAGIGTYGSGGFGGDGGFATSASLNFPLSVGLDNSGNIYIADTFNYRVRKVSSSGQITTIAGNGSNGQSGDGGVALSARIQPNAVAVDSQGNLFILSGSVIRRVQSSDLSLQPDITWSTMAPGQIDQTGNFTSNSFAGSGAILARSGMISATANITVVDYPPTAAFLPLANPNPVNGHSTLLDVLGADDAGEAALQYTWSVTPAGQSTFHPLQGANGTNSAKSMPVTFSKAGLYTFQVLIKDSGTAGTVYNLNVVVNAVPQSIAISPATASLHVGQTLQLSVGGLDQFGNSLTGAQPVWTSTGGTVDAQNVFHAGPHAGVFPITATLNGVSASSTVTILNDAPSIAAPAASPNPVSGRTTLLTVLGADDGGEPNLKYNWSSTGPAPVSFAALNGTNSASHMLVTFSQPGTYSFKATVSDADNLSAVSTPVIVTVNAVFSTIAVTPANVAVPPGGTQQFTAQALDQFGHAIAPGAPFSWSINDGGAVSASGFFAAANLAGGPYTLTVSSGAVSGTASFSVTSIPVISNLIPTDTTWVNLARPVLSGGLAGTQLNTDSLIVQLQRGINGQVVDYSGIIPVVNPAGTHFDAPVPYDLDEGDYKLVGTISNKTGQTGTAASSFSVDFTPPVISGLTASATVQNPVPAIAAEFTDALSGISSVSLLFDGIDVTANAAVTPNADGIGAIEYTPPAVLAFGAHQIMLLVTDYAGNQASAASALTVIDPTIDITAPIFGSVSVLAGGFVSLNINPNIAVAYSDPGAVSSGVDLARTAFELRDGNGNLAAAPTVASADANGIVLTLPSGLSNGAYSLKVTIYDLAGNGPVSSQTYFFVDSTPPTVAFITPNAALTGDSAPASLMFTLDEPDSGVDWSTLQVRINGVDYANSGTVTGDAFMLNQTLPLSRILEISVHDYAGNLLDYVQPTAAALSHFAVQDSNGNWVESDTPNFGAINANPGTDKTYNFRASYALDTLPDTFSIAGLSNTTIDPNPNPPATGYIYFHSTFPQSNVQVPFALSIGDAGGGLYTFSGTLYVFTAAAAPAISNFTPTPNTAQPYPPLQSITFSATGGTIRSAALTINGAPAVLDASSTPLPAAAFTGRFTPLTPLPSGNVVFGVTATNILGLTATANFTLAIADSIPPVITQTTVLPTYVTTATVPVAFTVTDSGYGVDANKTRVNYTVNGAAKPALLFTSATSAGLPNFAFTFPDTFKDGDSVNYTLHAEDLNSLVPNVTSQFHSFIVDLAPPDVGNLAYTGTQFTFAVSDSVTPATWTAYAAESASGTVVGSTSGTNPVGTAPGTFIGIITPQPTLTAGVAYTVYISAQDGAGHVTNVSQEFLIGGAASDTAPPSIVIAPGNNTNATDKSISVVVTDKGAGMSTDGVQIAFDGTMVSPASMFLFSSDRF